ncbi:MAG: hydantoin racemase [Actinobacteria bacterium]|nr:hydantoin racemase [Actinomycetota bacterium]
MRIRAITPIVVPNEELVRRQARYAALAPPPLEIELVSISGGPDRLESAEQIRESEQWVFDEAMRTDPRRYDAILPDCVLDPALERLASEAPVPVFGITKLTAGYLAALGHTFGAVTRTSAIANELTGRIEAFGLGGHLDVVKVLHLDLEDIVRTETWNGALAAALDELKAHNVDSVINGCSAVEVQPSQGPTVIDPTALALELLALAARRHLVVRRTE